KVLPQHLCQFRRLSNLARLDRRDSAERDYLVAYRARVIARLAAQVSEELFEDFALRPGHEKAVLQVLNHARQFETEHAVQALNQLGVSHMFLLKVYSRAATNFCADDSGYRAAVNDYDLAVHEAVAVADHEGGELGELRRAAQSPGRRPELVHLYEPFGKLVGEFGIVDARGYRVDRDAE